VVQPAKIAKNYIKGRFWIDLLASIPFEKFLIVDASADSANVEFKIFGLLKMIRLLRLGRIITYMKFKQSLKIGFRIF